MGKKLNASLFTVQNLKSKNGVFDLVQYAPDGITVVADANGKLSSSAAGGVSSSRTITTVAPLAGGGNLTADRVLSISPATTTDAGTMSAADKTKLDGLPSTAPPISRSISTTSPLIGGGDLTADRTLSIPAATNSVDGYLTAADHTLFAASGTVGTGSASVAVGPGATTNGSSNGVVIGRNSTANNNSDQSVIAIGDAATAEYEGISLGRSAYASAGTIAMGTNANSSGGSDNICIGIECAVSGQNSVGVGKQVAITHNNSIGLGRGATSTANNQAVIGSTGTGIEELRVQGSSLQPLFASTVSASSGDTGVKIVANVGSGAAQKSIKAAVVPPAGSFLLYIDP